MSRALIAPISIAAFALIAVAGCSKLERGDSSIKRGGTPSPTSIRTKLKANEKKNSDKTNAIEKASGDGCLKMPAVAKELQSGSDFYTVYTRDVDAGSLTVGTNNTGSCLTLDSVGDEKSRAVLAFGSRNKPLFFATEAKDLNATPLAELFDFQSQDQCEAATYNKFTPAEAGTFKVACSGEKSITLVRKDAAGKVALARTYTLNKDNLVVIAYQPAGYPAGCKGEVKELYVRTISVIKFGTAEKVTLSRAFAVLLDKYVLPKQPELAGALAAKDSDRQISDRVSGLSISSGTYALLHDAIEKQSFDKVCQ